MANKNQTTISKDVSNKKLTIVREFEASAEQVWRAWTESELLDQWWAPKPWRAETKSMDFRKGGSWLYAMIGPENEKHWSKADYGNIDTYHSFEGTDYFCDETGKKNPAMPTSHWKVNLLPSGAGTRVIVDISFTSEKDMKTLIEMGFEEGFTAALSNLDHYFATRAKMYHDLKPANTSRVSTYLNFPGNTEDAFNFYKKVFGTEFLGKGIQRFGDIPPQEGQPPMSETDKKLIIHVELPILGGHIIMATDAPESMGFKVEYGNNMFINLEPATRKETKKLFEALSDGGKITMELQDMFWGAYFGTCIDKYGINWMLNCIER
jgi:uncharacterized glyoxalase superfamily protein PhnB/uncharacterized protein YndB with AHSA1/START domain